MATRKKSSTRKKSNGSGRKRGSSQDFPWERELLLFVILAVSILIFISNIGKGGVVGGYLSSFFFGLFGILSYVFPVVLFLIAAFLISNRNTGGKGAAYSGRVILKTVSGVLLFLFLCAFAHLVYHDTETVNYITLFRDSASHKSGGGLIGAVLGQLFTEGFGILGAYILTIIILIVCVVLLTERSFFRGVSKGSKKVYESARADAARRREINTRKSEQRRVERENQRQRRMDNKISGVAVDTKIRPEEQKKATDNLNELNLDQVQMAEEFVRQQEPEIPITEPEIHMPQMPEEEIVSEPEAPPVKKRAKQPRQEKKAVEAEINEISQEIGSQESEENRRYIFPVVSLLKKGNPRMVGDSRAHLQEMSAKLQMTLTNFGVNARVTNVVCRTVTQYEIQPEMGVKVSKILNLSDDIKLNLAVPDIRIEAPIPGKAAIGIEVPNKENVTVAFRDLIESKEFQNHPSSISFCVGKDIAGNVIVADIAKMPHLLIAGATGSGKSVCINTIIMSILYKAKPDEVKLIMIDPKVVELSVYNGIPHLFIPVVTDPKKAAGALHWAVAEMTDRYQKFSEYGVRDIKGYNQKVESIKDIEDENKPKKMPQIVIIVDELADLMMVAPGDVEDAICRLAQLARAAGIHLIIATQRPSVNVITGLIKANMPSRIAFSVTSGIDSRTDSRYEWCGKASRKRRYALLSTGISEAAAGTGRFYD
ncbi:MAG: DNA translocase FtsK [Eubacterium sp.]